MRGCCQSSLKLERDLNSHGIWPLLLVLIEELLLEVNSLSSHWSVWIIFVGNRNVNHRPLGVLTLSILESVFALGHGCFVVDNL